MNFDMKKLARFLLTLCCGFIGSCVINHSSLKIDGWKSRTKAYFFLGLITLGIYQIIASIFNLVFDEKAESNIGYYKEVTAK